MISVVIPVRNGGSDLVRCLDAIDRQRVDDEVEVVVVDSSSTDGSQDVARERGAQVHEIDVADFNHGGARNLGASLAKGEILVFTSQDAFAEDDEWLARLTAPLRADESVAGVYGRQLPHADATPPERFFLNFLYGPEPRTQQVSGAGELNMDTTLFSNVNGAMRRSAWEAFPFADDIIMSEDQEWCRRVLLAGHRIAYEPRAAVRHSHPYTIRSAFKRFFDSGVSAERAYLAGAAPSKRVLRQAAIRYATGETRWLVRSGNARWLPYAAVYELAKFAGLQMGANHRRLPRSLVLRCTALPQYWTLPSDAERT